MKAPMSETASPEAATVGAMRAMMEAPQEENGTRTVTGADVESMM